MAKQLAGLISAQPVCLASHPPLYESAAKKSSCESLEYVSSFEETLSCSRRASRERERCEA